MLRAPSRVCIADPHDALHFEFDLFFFYPKLVRRSLIQITRCLSCDVLITFAAPARDDICLFEVGSPICPSDGWHIAWNKLNDMAIASLIPPLFGNVNFDQRSHLGTGLG
jgi:hypothetical protein